MTFSRDFTRAEITTARTVLRLLRSEDVTDEYVSWLNDLQINRFLESRWTRHTRKNVREFVRVAESDPDVYLFGIYCKGVHIGNIKLGPINHHHLRGNIGLMIGVREYWGQGVASEVIRGLTEFAFGTLHLEKIDAGCYESNQASRKAFLKAGFSEEAYLPVHVIHDGRREGVWLLGKLAPALP